MRRNKICWLKGRTAGGCVWLSSVSFVQLIIETVDAISQSASNDM